MMLKGQAPLRIDFGGGWTDVPAYAEQEGGAVLNAAVTLYAKGYIRDTPPANLFNVLSARHSRVSYQVEAPAGAGLGASAAQTVLWVSLVKTTISNVSERADIAEIAWKVEGLLGIVGGKQDEYASALGGIRYHTFGSTVRSEKLTLPPGAVGELRSRLLLVYTGEQRLSSYIHHHVWQSFSENDPRVIAALSQLKRIAYDMRRALESSDFDGWADLVAENWTNQKQLHPTITSDTVDSLLALAGRHGASAGKACGAGGGGCLLLVARRGQKEELRAALRAKRVTLLDFDFEWDGVSVRRA